ALIDYLLSPAVESMLARTRAIQIPLNPSATVGLPPNVLVLGTTKRMAVSFTAAAECMKRSAEFIREEFAT
ncbi:MAG: iron transporter, partial [Candidatus Hydrogenedentes bacterium]|nr:iron transporter [Candidatus Hydrogenedentota bacterium]